MPGTQSFRRAILGICLALGAAAAARAAETPDGRGLYRQNCAACHGGDRSGGAGPPLSGMLFDSHWAGKPAELGAQAAKTMPPGAEGSLSTTEYAAIADYLLHPDAAPAAAPVRDATPVSLPAPPRRLSEPTTKGPDDAELLASSATDWLRYNGDLRGQRYSALSQISAENAGQLAPKCIFQTGETGAFQASPIVRAGKLYITTSRRTYALDAATCRLLWSNEYVASDPETTLQTNRGVALYQGLVIRGTLDAHLIALDAATGKLVWDVRVADSRDGYFLSAAPLVFDGKVYIGEAGADFGAAGHLNAFDAATGRSLWRFNIIPADGEPGRETWPKTGRRGGGSMWTTITVDPEARILYASTGNPDSDFNGAGRKGSNLYSNAMIALSADTGKLIWHHQQNPFDEHDWDTAAAPMIYEAGGRKLMAVGSKDDRVYFYDRGARRLLYRRDLSRRVSDTVPLLPDQPVRVCPGILGGVEWNGPAFDPANSQVLVNSVDWCATITKEKEGLPYSTGGGSIKIDPPALAKGALRAFDGATGQERWRFDSDSPMVAGVTPTAGGVIFTGTSAGEFMAFRSRDGAVLYRFFTGGPVAGGVVTYSVGGKQLVAVASGNESKSIWQTRGAATVVVFGLP